MPINPVNYFTRNQQAGSIRPNPISEATMSQTHPDILRRIQETKDKEVKILNLSYQTTQIKLSQIPPEIFDLKHLEQLDLQDQAITALPEELAQLSNLTTLDLSSNNLTTLPEGLAQLSNLIILYLNYNKLTSLPEGLAQLSNLTTLYLDKNPIETPPPEVLSLDSIGRANLENIRNYFRQLWEAGVERLYEAKLLIIGEAGAGKTSLAKKIVDPTYQLIPEEASTEGIGVAPWSSAWKTANPSGSISGILAGRRSITPPTSFS